MDLLKERVQDIRNLQNGQAAVNQIKYREKIRSMIEQDCLVQLHQTKKLNQQDLISFQEALKIVIRIIAPNFELGQLDLSLASTAKLIIELYSYFGLHSQSEQLFHSLGNTKQAIFLNLLSHVIELTRMALQFTIKRQTDMRIFCIGKEIEKKKSLSNPPKRLHHAQRSESNYKDKFYSKQSINEYETNSPKASPQKSQNHIEKIPNTSRDKSIPKSNQNEIISKKTLPYILPKINQNQLLQQLKQRNFQISQTIQNYAMKLQDKNTLVD